MFTARDIMSSKVVTVDPDDTIDHAVSLLVEHGVSGLPVLDKAGHVVGVISEFDLLEVICEGRTAKDKVCHYMSTHVCMVGPDDDWVSVADMFRCSHIRRLPVTHDNRLVGIVSRHDLMRAIQDARKHVRHQCAHAAKSRVWRNARIHRGEASR